jgi:hypothetical protein
MNLDRFDAYARAFAAPSRRQLLSAATAASALFAPLMLLSPAEARKHKKRKRKNKNKRCPACPICPSPPAQPTCAGSCAETCRFCFTRPEASMICGESYSQTTCGTASCSSDADCVGVGDTPYCVAQAIERASGIAFPLCTVNGQDTPLCARIDPCV